MTRLPNHPQQAAQQLFAELASDLHLPLSRHPQRRDPLQKLLRPLDLEYLKREDEQAAFSIDEDKLQEEARYDGLWVLRTNTRLWTHEVAFQHKQLWIVKQAFRAVKSVLETRLIYHRCDDTIRGHVFCSFLALMLMKALLSRLEATGKIYEWKDIKRDFTALREVEIVMDKDRYCLRTELRGCCFDVLQAAGVAVPATLRG